MSANLSMQDRIARTRRLQSRALDSAGQEAARTAVASEARLDSRGPAANEAVVARRPVPAPAERAAATLLRNPDYADLSKEMVALLPGVTSLYGYTETDVSYLKAAVAADRAGALDELRTLVRQWRIDVVTNGLDLDETLVPHGVAERARTQFRMDIMGATEDEGGMKYAPTVLDWRPEGQEYTIPGPSLPVEAVAPVARTASKKRKP